MPDIDLSAQIHIESSITTKPFTQAIFGVMPTFRWIQDLIWNNAATIWDIAPWQGFSWAERFRPLFASRVTLSGDRFLYWDLFNSFWNDRDWYMVIIEAALRDSWTLDLGLIYRERNLSLLDEGENRPVRWTVVPNPSHEVFLPYDNDRYLQLPTWQHRRPKFLEMLEDLISGYVDMENLSYLISTRRYNVLTAVGYELDVIGDWVGVSREVYPPFSSVYFTWNGNKYNGWNMGLWQAEGDWSLGLTRLGDEPYRFLIMAKIVANMWDGTVESAYEAWHIAFGGQSEIVVFDHQDMSMDLYVSAPEDDTIIRAILAEEKIPLRPCGVKVNSRLVPFGQPVFMWDVEETRVVAGWNVGYWLEDY